MSFALLLSILFLFGCAKPTTQRPTASLPEISQEITFQAREEFRQRADLNNRIQRVADTILMAGSDFCNDVKEESGFYYFDKNVFDEVDLITKDLFLDYYGLSEIGDYPYIYSVRQGSGAEKGGMRKGDRIVRFNQRSVKPEFKEVKLKYIDSSGIVYKTEIKEKWVNILKDQLRKSLIHDEVPVEVTRDDTTLKFSISRDKICINEVFSVQGGQVNAYTDGKNISITVGMAKFASDEELALVIAHELAHCVEGHIGKKRKNSILGSLAGGIVDGLVQGGLGVQTYGKYGRRGEQIGADAFSQAFELEADYIGLYILARAGYSTENAADFWRKIAEQSPLESNSLTGTHPPTAERYISLTKTHAEIERKKANKEELLPNRMVR